MAKIIVKQVRSRIKTTQNQKRTLDALGLRKLNATIIHEDTPNILGMVAVVRHLVCVEHI